MCQTYNYVIWKIIFCNKMTNGTAKRPIKKNCANRRKTFSIVCESNSIKIRNSNLNMKKIIARWVLISIQKSNQLIVKFSQYLLVFFLNERH